MPGHRIERLKEKTIPELKPYLKFVISYILVPGTASFYFLQQYIHPITAYFISSIFWASVIYFYNRRAPPAGGSQQAPAQQPGGRN